jgi:hypothetical protein
MPHQASIIAAKVLANENHYPEVVVSMAKEIKQNRELHRERIKKLWGMHHVLKFWIKQRNERYQHARETESKISAVTASRFASARTNLEFGPVTMATFHQGKNQFNTEYFMFNNMARRFIAAAKLVEEMDVTLVNRYLACVNAERFDSTVAPVGYLRDLDGNVTCEILAWRLLQSSTNQ